MVFYQGTEEYVSSSLVVPCLRRNGALTLSFDFAAAQLRSGRTGLFLLPFPCLLTLSVA
jgi:hypothetical protein